MRHPTAPYDREVVVRRIDRPVDTLCLPTGFVLEPTALTITWRAPARVGRNRVQVEVAAWSAGATEVRILPVSRNVHLWTERHRRRYFTAAHALADALAIRLRRSRDEIGAEAAPISSPVRRAVGREASKAA